MPAPAREAWYLPADRTNWIEVDQIAQEDRWADDREAAHDWGAFTLGVSVTTPLELANAYATLAADGTWCAPTPVQEIRGPDGRTLEIARPRCEKRVDTDVARAAVDVARCPVGDDSATSRCGGSRTAESLAAAMHGKPRIDFPPAPTELIR